ncbi:putative two-component response regulator ARR19 [Arabidopsis thaliana]
MLVGKISGYEDNTRSLERETSEITSLLSQFPGNTNVLVVDTNFTTLLNMKQIMKQYAYQVSIETDAEKALAFLTSCKHEINIVIWDFHMPGIDGLQALKSITSKLDLPVVIMSDDNQTESVMKATFYGACDYVVKPVKEEVMANIWQHIVRKRLIFKPDVAPPKPRMTWSKVFQPVQSHLVPTDGLDRDHFDSITINGGNGIQNMEKKQGKKPRKPRMTWTEELHQKFLEAIEIIGGIEKANPKVLVECLQEMRIEGITRSNVASHLQKHRINLEENQIPQQTQGNGWATAYGTLATSLQGSDNVNTTIPSYLMNGPATLNQIQQNQYQNGFLTMNNNQIITNPPPPLPYLDHHHQQQHQSSPQFNYLMNNEELLQASGLSATDLELTYPSLPYDPQEYLINGYNYN